MTRLEAKIIVMHPRCTHSAHDGPSAHALTLDRGGEDIRDGAVDATVMALIGLYIWAHDTDVQGAGFS